MQVARTRFVKKCVTLSSVAKKETSCSRGWLRLVIQSIFAFITTASFILIVMMAVRNPDHNRPREPARPARCSGCNCKVVCNEAPYYGLYEEDIFDTVEHAETICERVTLELNNPAFENNTLPSNWLSRMRSNIYQLSIIDGNLNYLSPTAFMSQFTGSIKVLILQDLHLYTWETNSLVGLSSLEELTITNCQIDSFQTDSIRAVDDTLETLTITESGYWNPIYVTGSIGFEKLTVVNFSKNDFNAILGRDTFVGLEICKILYLNSCGIVSIGEGAFDSLKSIEVIYLDFNLLVTVPPGLFDSILLLDNPRPRISLQENFWHCDCDSDLRQLVRYNVLLVEGICTSPSSMNGKTFTELDNICLNETSYSNGDKVLNNAEGASYSGLNDNKVYVNGKCRKKNGHNKTFDEKNMKITLISPQANNRCSLNISKAIDISLLSKTLISVDNFENSYWLKFSFYLKTNRFNAIHIGAAKMEDYGILWFQSDCPDELYCIDSMPTVLRIFNIDENAQFTFCPVQLTSGDIDSNSCIGYMMNDLEKYNEYYEHLSWMMWILTVLGCVCLGASIVYGLIRTNPILLKGSKRIVFVKHKTVDALVLPPKVPMRNNLINDTTFDYKDKEIFTLFANEKLMPPTMNRMKSVRSNKSSSPSYISALQPSEDQLADWRINRHFNNDLSIISKSELSTLSWICNDTSYSLDESDRTYESLK